MSDLGLSGSVRMSLYLYNTRSDIDKFFTVFTEIIRTPEKLVL